MPARPPFLLYSDGSIPLARVKKKGVASETTSYIATVPLENVALADRLKLAMLVTGELLIFSLGDYHKLAVSCVSYPCMVTCL